MVFLKNTQKLQIKEIINKKYLNSKLNKKKKKKK